jgi:hypothetical protein
MSQPRSRRTWPGLSPAPASTLHHNPGQVNNLGARQAQQYKLPHYLSALSL